MSRMVSRESLEGRQSGGHETKRLINPQSENKEKNWRCRKVFYYCGSLRSVRVGVLTAALIALATLTAWSVAPTSCVLTTFAPL